jgi:hypothetical protein
MWSKAPHARWRAVWEHGAERETLGTFATARAAAVAHDNRTLVHAHASAKHVDVKLNFDDSERHRLQALGAQPGGDVYDAALARAAEAQGWAVEALLGGPLAFEGDGGAAAARAAHAAMVQVVEPVPLPVAEAADTDAHAAARMSAVVEAAKAGDSLALSVLTSLEAGQAQDAAAAAAESKLAPLPGSQELPLPREQAAGVEGFVKALQHTSVHGAGSGVSIAAGADPVAVQLQLAADAQAASLAPVPAGQTGMFDGHIVRM